MTWLRSVVKSKSPKTRSAALWNLINYNHDLDIAEAALRGDAVAFANWNKLLSASSLANRMWTAAFLRTATTEAKYADSKAANLAANTFQTWLHEGPSLRKQHMLSRTTTGWITSPVAPAPSTDIADTHRRSHNGRRSWRWK